MKIQEQDSHSEYKKVKRHSKRMLRRQNDRTFRCTRDPTKNKEDHILE